MEVYKKDLKSYFFNLVLLLAFIFSLLSIYMSVRMSDQIKDLERQITASSEPESLDAIGQSLLKLEEKLRDSRQLNLEQEKQIQVLSQKVRTIGPKGSSSNRQLPNEVRHENYLIQAGDTLSQIAQSHGVSLSDLIDLNQSVDPKRLQIGQTIRIPLP